MFVQFLGFYDEFALQLRRAWENCSRFELGKKKDEKRKQNLDL